MDILELAKRNQSKALQVVEELKIQEAWASIGATANLVGSLKTGLLMKNRDIDFHVYSDDFKVEESFSAITKMAQNPRVKHIDYKNLLDTDEKCLEWHLWYEDSDKNLWQIDMIHILKGSFYDGYFENVAEKISEVLTPELKLAILTIKNDTPENIKIPGIQVYQAVIQGGVRNYEEFELWNKENPMTEINMWHP